MSGVELSGVEMSTFGIKIEHFNPRLYNRIYCVIPGVEMSGVEMSPTRFTITPGLYFISCDIISFNWRANPLQTLKRYFTVY